MQITRLTENDYEDTLPEIHQNGIVWQACPDNDCTPFGGNYEVYYWNGSMTQKLSDNSNMDRYPRIYGNRVVWQSKLDGTLKIVFWQGDEKKEISGDSLGNQLPKVNDDWVVWAGLDSNDFEIYAWDGQGIIEITDNEVADVQPEVCGDRIVWISDRGFGAEEETQEICLWEAGETLQLTDDDLADRHPRVDDETVVWEAHDGHDYEIAIYRDEVIEIITDNNYDDSNPEIHNGMIVWQSFDGQDYEIFFWYDGTSTQLTDNNFDDISPQISDRAVVWQACPDNDCLFFSSGNWEIYYFDGEQNHRVTYNDTIDYSVKVYGSNLCWMSYDEESMEIYMGNLANETPFPTTMTPTPAPTPSPHQTPMPESIFLDLRLNNNFFSAGDLFLLDIDIVNFAPAQNIDLYVFLDVYDNYWFWPSWVMYPAMDTERIFIPAQDVLRRSVLNFIWPENSGAGTDIFFWSMASAPSSYELISNIESESFDYGGD